MLGVWITIPCLQSFVISPNDFCREGLAEKRRVVIRTDVQSGFQRRAFGEPLALNELCVARPNQRNDLAAMRRVDRERMTLRVNLRDCPAEFPGSWGMRPTVRAGHK